MFCVYPKKNKNEKSTCVVLDRDTLFHFHCLSSNSTSKLRKSKLIIMIIIIKELDKEERVERNEVYLRDFA